MFKFIIASFLFVIILPASATAQTTSTHIINGITLECVEPDYSRFKEKMAKEVKRSLPRSFGEMIEEIEFVLSWDLWACETAANPDRCRADAYRDAEAAMAEYFRKNRRVLRTLERLSTGMTEGMVRHCVTIWDDDSSQSSSSVKDSIGFEGDFETLEGDTELQMLFVYYFMILTR